MPSIQQQRNNDQHINIIKQHIISTGTGKDSFGELALLYNAPRAATVVPLPIPSTPSSSSSSSSSSSDAFAAAATTAAAAVEVTTGAGKSSSRLSTGEMSLESLARSTNNDNNNNNNDNNNNDDDDIPELWALARSDFRSMLRASAKGSRDAARAALSKVPFLNVSLTTFLLLFTIYAACLLLAPLSIGVCLTLSPSIRYACIYIFVHIPPKKQRQQQQKGLSEEQLTSLSFNAESRDFAPGEAIVRKGEPGNTFFMITSGAVRCSTNPPATGERREDIYIYREREREMSAH